VQPPPYPPIEPPPSRVAFPDPRDLGDTELVAIGPDYSPGTFVAAFRRGIFPWPMSSTVVPWVSPIERAVHPLEPEPHWSRSLARKLRQHDYEVTIDRAFADVVGACGDEREDGTWIVPEMKALYLELHRLGIAHSLEVWSADTQRALVGGIFGIALGGAFSGESMFHRRTDASKIAFAELVARLRSGGFRLFDVQVLSSHLASLGCVAIPRDEYVERLERALPASARLA
jgi:leucyl/phenylalanyl-tRNA--protein transferase